MKEVDFDVLEKKCNTVAEEFLEELELLPVFLNYFPAVREKWLKEIGCSKREIKQIEEVCDYYAKNKIKLINKKKPKTRKQVIKIEDEVLKRMYQGRFLNIKKGRIDKRTTEKIVKLLFKGAVVLTPEQLGKLEDLLLFKNHIDRTPLNFLIFDSKKKKIIGVELVKKC